MKFKAPISAVLLALFVLLGSAVPALGRDNCDKNVRKAEKNLSKEIRKHGERSPQAEYRRRQLAEVRHQCGYDRDHDRDRKDHDRDRKDHDRDRHDHDRDHDHK